MFVKTFCYFFLAKNTINLPTIARDTTGSGSSKIYHQNKANVPVSSKLKSGSAEEKKLSLPEIKTID